jgi:glutamate-1-semialdehyde 2,1-aminomutase
MSIAVRIARASAKKDVIAFCGYHGWHDWYLAANLSDNKNLDGHLLPGLAPAGVPRALIGTSLPFQYNHLEELQKIADAHPESLAAIVMEPVRDHEPDPHFISGVQKIARENDAVLIVDEVSAGFRISTGGAHLRYSLKPDIAVFAKAMGNGYPMAAIIGTDTVMEAAQDTFVSSTNWTEGIGPVAALATIDKYRRCDVPRHLVASGLAIQQGWSQAAQESGLDIEVGGIPPLSHFAFQCDESLDAQTAFTQIMLKKGFLAGKSFYASYSHTNEHIESYLTATRDAFRIIAKHLEEGNLKSILDGPVAQPGFHRLT